ncbi:MAG: methyltransferase domain-containing protein [Xanthobacteraceae bacterium]
MLAIDTISPASPAARARPAPPENSDLSLVQVFAKLGVEADCEWAIANYKRTVEEFRNVFGARRLIEIGGGRDPLFDLAETHALGIDMTINDIAPGELAVLPSDYHTACFDIAGDDSRLVPFRNKFDLAFSRMVFEHVADGQRAWANLYELLAPGGVALIYIPTLYALPFIANWLLPDRLAAQIVKMLYKNRTDDEDPVFPARYSWCFTDARLSKMLSAIGYREIFIQPFYGHGYYKPVPIIHKAQVWFADTARGRDWRPFTSFAYIGVRK